MLGLLARAAIGQDPRQVELVASRVDAAAKGYAYAKSALDMACWDLFGRATGMRVSDLLGGTYQEEFPLYTGVGIGEVETMRSGCADLVAAGYRRIQIKVGTGVGEDIERIRACAEVLGDAEMFIVDANGWWSQADAARVAAAVDDLDLYLEQPCGDARGVRPDPAGLAASADPRREPVRDRRHRPRRAPREPWTRCG